MRRNTDTAPIKDASKLAVGIVVSTYNEDITATLFDGATKTLGAWGVQEKNIRIVRVSGAFEIPFACLTLLSQKKKPNAIITLGCIVKGETEHDRHLAAAVTQGIMDVSLQYRTPISLGVLTTNNLAQARARSIGKNNAGVGATIAALELALLKR